MVIRGSDTDDGLSMALTAEEFAHVMAFVFEFGSIDKAQKALDSFKQFSEQFEVIRKKK